MAVPTGAKNTPHNHRGVVVQEPTVTLPPDLCYLHTNLILHVPQASLLAFGSEGRFPQASADPA